LVTAPGASQRETGPITIRKGDVVDARTTTRLGKVLSFFGVLLLVFGLLQSGAGAANERSRASDNASEHSHQHATTTVAQPAAAAAATDTDCGSYCSTTDGTPSANGNGGGNGNQPCAGCVGNADNKNPPGQANDGSDHNNGYECDGNNGVGKTNPAHSGCQPTTTVPCTGEQCSTTTTQPQQTTTTAPRATTTTTVAAATTTTAAVEGTTTTTAEVLGVQFTRGEEQARGLASTGSTYFRPFTMLGALLLLLGVALMTIKVRPLAKA
jgi:hypothetical protein